uniref:Uncharacterized protein n=1 Tax=Tetranychus urticae TaxID=32264 RepID=T1KY19_TETUR
MDKVSIGESLSCITLHTEDWLREDDKNTNTTEINLLIRQLFGKRFLSLSLNTILEFKIFIGQDWTILKLQSKADFLESLSTRLIKLHKQLQSWSSDKPGPLIEACIN